MLVNGKRQEMIALADRGFQYGDGLFETIEVRANHPLFLKQHLRRLTADAKRLYLPEFDVALLHSEIEQLCKNAGDAILKIIITRGTSGRGYRQPDVIQPSRILSLHPFSDYPKSYYSHGIVARLCKTRLGLNPVLAGIKHLNRLEQVMARAEWNDTSIQEGIMLDFNGYVTEGTMTNLFYAKNGKLFTPLLTYCGIAGIMRGWICEQFRVIEGTFFMDELFSADEIFVCNSVIGIWGIRELENKNYTIGEITKKLQLALIHEKQKQVAYAME